ncbi:hypothetical protein Droror1_Dr00020796 [Drosera rotundifolia]
MTNDLAPEAEMRDSLKLRTENGTHILVAPLRTEMNVRRTSGRVMFISTFTLKQPRSPHPFHPHPHPALSQSSSLTPPSYPDIGIPEVPHHTRPKSELRQTHSLRASSIHHSAPIVTIGYHNATALREGPSPHRLLVGI